MYGQANDDITAENFASWAGQVLDSVFGSEEDHYIHAKVDFWSKLEFTLPANIPFLFLLLSHGLYDL